MNKKQFFSLDALQLPKELWGLDPEDIAKEFLTLTAGDMVFIRKEVDHFCTARVSGFRVRGSNLIVDATQVNPNTGEDVGKFSTMLVHPIIPLNDVPKDEWLDLQRFCLGT